MPLFEDFMRIMFFLMIFAAVLFLAFVFTKYVGSKASKSMKGKYINIIDTVPLGMDKRLMLVKVADQYILMASSSKSLEYITTLKTGDLGEEGEEEDSVTPFDFRGIFDKYLHAIKAGRNKRNESKTPFSEGEITENKVNDVFRSNLSRLRSMSGTDKTDDKRGIKEEYTNDQ